MKNDSQKLVLDGPTLTSLSDYVGGLSNALKSGTVSSSCKDSVAAGIRHLEQAAQAFAAAAKRADR